MELHVYDPTDGNVAALWRRLDAPTYFQTWEYLSAWQAALDREHRSKLAIVTDAGIPRAGFLMKREGLLVPRVHVASLVRSQHHPVPLDQLLALLPGRWDEAVLPAIDVAAYPELGRYGRTHKVRVDREELAPYVDLHAVRGVPGGYLAMLDPSVRAQIAHARHDRGALAIELASDARHAMDIYGELLRLHAREAVQHHERSAFADPWHEQFHRQLVTEQVGSGAIQLLRIANGARTIGCLYNMVHAGRVVAYQAGFADVDGAHLLCHALAVAHAAASGLDRYEIQSRELATSATRLAWLRIGQPGLAHVLADLGRAVRQRRLAAASSH
jgi:CelD/BcsL family acetyltransferase involved in cellulose biosynthesis